MRRAALALAALALTLTGCETTAEKSAKLEKLAKQEAKHRVLARRGLSITRQSTKVLVSATAVLASSEGSAAVITLHNRSASTLRDLPIEITVRDAHGATIYTNANADAASTLASVPLLRAHATSTWIDDQVQGAGVPASVSARIGEGEAVNAAIPRVVIESVHLREGEAEGSVVNHSAVGQRELVIYAVARRAGRIVAAGRAIVPQADPSSSAHFQLFFIGDAKGAQLEVSAPPSTVG